jgi:predicted transcriptional regulator
MTTKEKALTLIQSLDDNVSYEVMIERLYLLQKVELAIEQANRGEVVDHDEFMAELEQNHEV